MERKVNLAIIGLGHVSDYQLEALNYINNLSLRAACDIDRSKASKLNDNVMFDTEFKTILSDSSIDAILISTPNKEHYALAKEALHAGKDILLEKPATTTLKEYDQLVEIADYNKRFIHIAYHAAFAKDLLWFSNAFKEKYKSELGPISGFSCGFYDPLIIDGELQDEALSVGGSWIDSGINALSVIGKLIDPNLLEVEDCKLTSLAQYPISEIQGTVTFRFPIEVDDIAGVGTIDTNWTLNLNCKFSKLYFGETKSEILLDHSKQSVYKLTPDKKKERIFDGADKHRLVNHYIGVFEDFFESIKNRNSNIDYSRRLHEILYIPYSRKDNIKTCNE